MKKSLLITLITMCIITFAFVMNVSAEKEGIFTYSISNGEATITDCSASGDVVIPSTLGGYPVASIGDSAFWG